MALASSVLGCDYCSVLPTALTKPVRLGLVSATTCCALELRLLAGARLHFAAIIAKGVFGATAMAARRAATLLLGVVLLLGGAACAEKTWREWYWSEFVPDAGERAGPPVSKRRRRYHCATPPPPLPPDNPRPPLALLPHAAGPTTFDKADDFVIARNLW